MSRTKRKIGICGRGMKLLGCFSAAFATASVALAQAPSPTPTPLAGAFDPPYAFTGAIALPGGDKITSFDISFVDPVLNRYYLANRTSKAAIAVDTNTNKVVGNFKPGFAGFTGSNDTSGPDGILTVDHKEIWVGDAPSRVIVLDAVTGAQIGLPISTSPIPGGGASTTRADEMCYDPVDKILMVANNADSPPFVTFISTTTKSVLGKVAFDGTNGTPNSSNGAEQCVWNPRNGKFYITIPEAAGPNGPGDNSAPGAVVMLDPVSRKV